jgi:hypothetical protein
MSSFPKLSYVCPIPWSELKGDDRKKFCEKCGLHVTNLSALNEAARQALVKRAETESICVSYYLCSNGDCVTPESSHTREDRSRIKRYGALALSAGALALGASCTSVSTPEKKPMPSSAPEAKVQPSVPSAPRAAGNDDVVQLPVFGMICVDPKKK